MCITTDLRRHFALGELDADGAAIGRKKERALQRSHRVCRAENVLVLHEGDRRPTLGVHAEAAEAGEAVQQEQPYRVCRVMRIQ